MATSTVHATRIARPERYNTSLERKKDIFDVGMIFCELLAEEFKQTDRGPSSKIRSFAAFKAIVTRCADSDPRLRPSVEALKKSFDLLSASKHDVVVLMLKRVEKSTEILESRVATKTAELVAERAKSDALLKEMLPAVIVQKLRNKIKIDPEYFDSVTISFSDLPGFVTWISTAKPYDVVKLLNAVYSLFDEEISLHPLVHKIETISDCYMVASGVPILNGTEHAPAVCRLAKSLQNIFAARKIGNNGLLLRIGIHSGVCAASVIGRKVPRYCLFGDAVNTASRMESNGEGGRIHLSPSTAGLLAQYTEFSCERRGTMQIKGKGEMETFWLLF